MTNFALAARAPKGIASRALKEKMIIYPSQTPAAASRPMGRESSAICPEPGTDSAQRCYGRLRTRPQRYRHAPDGPWPIEGVQRRKLAFTGGAGSAGPALCG